MYDRTTMDCKLFKGSLSDLEGDCTEIGYAVSPPYDECNVTNVAQHGDGCYVSKITEWIILGSFIYCFDTSKIQY